MGASSRESASVRSAVGAPLATVCAMLVLAGCITGKQRPAVDGDSGGDAPIVEMDAPIVEMDGKVLGDGPTSKSVVELAGLALSIDKTLTETGGPIVVCNNFNGSGKQAIAIGLPVAPGNAGQNEAGQVVVLLGPDYGISATEKTIKKSGGVTHVLRVFGSRPGAHLGQALACGRVDGDTSDDLVISAPGYGEAGTAEEDAGAVYVFLGKPRKKEIDLNPASQDRDDVDLILLGKNLIAQGATHLGEALAVVRGVNEKSTFGAIAMGAPGLDWGTTTDDNHGAVFLRMWVDAPTPRVVTVDPTLAKTFKDDKLAALFGKKGEALGSVVAAGRLSSSVASAPDDIAAVAANATDSLCTACGAVRILRGRTLFGGELYEVAKDQHSLTIWGPKIGGGSNFGRALAIGDVVDSDNHADLIVSAPSFQEGEVYLFPGKAELLAGTASKAKTLAITNNDQKVTFRGERAGDQFGSAVALIRKTASGTTFDLAIGASSALEFRGAVYWIERKDTYPAVVTLPKDPPRLEVNGAEKNGRLGAYLSAGSINTKIDTDADLLLGAPGQAGTQATPAVYAIFR